MGHDHFKGRRQFCRLLNDSLHDICDRAGVAGAVFKLGAMAIPNAEPDPETRIGAKLTRTFLKTLDAQLTKHRELLSEDTWNRYRLERLEDVAKETLASQFTWLKVIGPNGRKSGRNWPGVHELADFARKIVLGALPTNGVGVDDNLSRLADDVRGIVHDALADVVDELIADPVIEVAFQMEQPKAARDALALLAENYQMLSRRRLFDEVPQDALFISPTVRVADYSKPEIREWERIPSHKNGDDLLFNELRKRAGRAGVIVIEGEMGVGKSCLMRVLAARLAEQYCRDRADGVLFANWRDIYGENNLIDGVARHVQQQYGLPIPGLNGEEHLFFFIDGFDEMKSHAENVVVEYFNSLVKLAHNHSSPIVLAMRSIAAMPPAASAYIRRHPSLSSEAMAKWHVGILPTDGGGDKRGWSLRNHVVYPFKAEDNEVIAFVGRDPSYEEKLKAFEAQPPEERDASKRPIKHRFPKNFQRGIELFGQQKERLNEPGFHEAIAKYGLVVVEGFNDVLALDSVSIPAVAICSNLITDEQIEKLARFAKILKCDVSLMFDCDDTGEAGAADAAWKLLQAGLNVRAVWGRAMHGGKFKDKQPEAVTTADLEVILSGCHR